MTSSAEERGAEFGGGKTREIFLYQKIILFASKKPHSCRNTWKISVFDPYDPKLLNLWVRLRLSTGRNIIIAFAFSYAVLTLVNPFLVWKFGSICDLALFSRRAYSFFPPCAELTLVTI